MDISFWRFYLYSNAVIRSDCFYLTLKGKKLAVCEIITCTAKCVADMVKCLCTVSYAGNVQWHWNRWTYANDQKLWPKRLLGKFIFGAMGHDDVWSLESMATGRKVVLFVSTRNTDLVPPQSCHEWHTLSLPDMWQALWHGFRYCNVKLKQSCINKKKSTTMRKKLL